MESEGKKNKGEIWKYDRDKEQILGLVGKRQQAQPNSWKG